MVVARGWRVGGCVRCLRAGVRVAAARGKARGRGPCRGLARGGRPLRLRALAECAEPGRWSSQTPHHASLPRCSAARGPAPRAYGGDCGGRRRRTYRGCRRLKQAHAGAMCALCSVAPILAEGAVEDGRAVLCGLPRGLPLLGACVDLDAVHLWQALARGASPARVFRRFGAAAPATRRESLLRYAPPPPGAARGGVAPLRPRPRHLPGPHLYRRRGGPRCRRAAGEVGRARPRSGIAHAIAPRDLRAPRRRRLSELAREAPRSAPHGASGCELRHGPLHIGARDVPPDLRGGRPLGRAGGAWRRWGCDRSRCARLGSVDRRC
mmetsp:Transcript_30810/g.89020  ORF Transcript_30810/g.89020 Transcript_30810/m.89020 type:complete len:323 (-) Transcript_30810:240-1208(-)